MSVFVGPLGGMVETPCLSDLSVSPATKRITRYGIDGSPEQLKVGQPWRTWSMAIGVIEPDDLGLLRTLAAEQSAPWWMVACDAQWTNLLTPTAARFRGWTGPVARGGPVATLDGVAGVSAVLNPALGSGATWPYLSPPVPLSPNGGPVTVSAYVLAGASQTAQVQAVLVDALGNQAAPVPAQATSTVRTGALARISTTYTTTNPAHIGVRVGIRGASLAANPAITWGPDLYGWSDGRGAARVVIGDVPEDVILAARGRAMSSASYTVQEVR